MASTLLVNIYVLVTGGYDGDRPERDTDEWGIGGLKDMDRR